MASDVTADPDVDPVSAARTICLHLLTSRSRTRAELSVALAKKNVPIEAAEAVLNRFTEVGLIDDRAFAAEFVAVKRAERGLSVFELSRQLRTKGVDNEIVESVVAGFDPESELEQARQLISRKSRSMHGLPDATATRRLAGLLARKGYSPEIVFRAVREVLAERDAAIDL
ncbi:MAG: hypothetical protein JWN95_3484 [Frankiales bacterium]|nr:hypothetical protein [Frankiales bacterium]